MLSKEDYKGYLEQIEDIEKMMIEVYQTCADKVEDDELRNIFAGLSEAEKRHASLVRELEKMIG